MEDCGIPAFLREGATLCVAWDGVAGIMLVSVDGAPYVAPFPPDAPVLPSATVGAGLYPAISGANGCVLEWSMSGGMGLAPPTADYAPFATLQVLPPTHSTRRPSPPTYSESS